MEKRTQKVLGIVALGILGNEVRQYSAFKRSINYTVSNFRVSRGTNKLVLTYKVNIENRTNATMPITHIGGNILSQGRILARFDTEGKVVVQPNKTTSIDVISHIGWSEGVSALLTALSKSTVYDLEYRVTATPTFLYVIPFPVVIRENIRVDFAPYIDAIKQVVKAIQDLSNVNKG